MSKTTRCDIANSPTVDMRKMHIYHAFKALSNLNDVAILPKQLMN